MILDERIAQELIERKKKLESDGKLLSSEQLRQYYATFRNRFGPDKLRNLDGEALLELMHSHGNKDSLVYWLEFKDDEEFPAKFGSIAGGSAFKFGLFRKSETGIWMTGSPMKPIELSVEQAIEVARKHRDQLLRGVELLEKTPEHGSDLDYNNLQQEMDRIAPDVSNSSWGHKYFSLLYPEKLDDYHNPDYQRFHLIKLLQLPPPGEGRYLVAGRYIAIAHELSLLTNNLTMLLNNRDGNPHGYWRIGTGGYTERPRSEWLPMRDGDYVAIGFIEKDDLSTIPNDITGKEKIRQLLHSAYPQRHPAANTNSTNQIFAFRWIIAPGDLVMASDGETVIGIGKVTDGYTYDPSSNMAHRRPVEWLSLEEWRQPDPEGKLTTVWRMKKDVNLIEVERRIFGMSPIITSPEPSPLPSPIPVPKPVALSPLPGISARIQAILERKGQVILYGPPGTGKTYWAEFTARELAARASFSTTFEQLTPEQRATLLGNDRTCGGRVRICTFHPAYGYEDFLEGFRPEPANGHMQFVPRDGVFKQLCKDALASPAEKFYLIIDEINRGEIPRIFGELLTVLEKDKRGKSILLPLTGKPFKVPDNVYIIGTMNTADRSIALLDTALRRRFGFIELMPDTEPLQKAVVGGIPLGPWLDALNRRICEHIGRDARNLQIGHAYLFEKGLPIADMAIFARVIREDVLPLLEEYCYEDYTKLEKILGSGLVDVKNQKIHHDLFEPSQQANLIQALLAPSPDITTSTQAVAAEAQTSVEHNGESEEVEYDEVSRTREV